jgi:hypothetical protein
MGIPQHQHGELAEQNFLENPHKAIWQAVLIKAAQDAARYNPKRDAKKQPDAYQAHDWLMGKGSWFQQVCSMADISPRDVMKEYSKERYRLANGCKQGMHRKKVMGAKARAMGCL